jgi:hypothetical protein
MLREEQKDRIRNYMKEAKSSLVDTMDSTHRDEAVLRIIELCNIKRYRDETVFLAINIFDRVF